MVSLIQSYTDGMVIIWAPSASPQASTYGSDLSPEDLQHEKEYWRPRTTFRLVFDLLPVDLLNLLDIQMHYDAGI